MTTELKLECAEVGDAYEIFTTLPGGERLIILSLSKEALKARRVAMMEMHLGGEQADSQFDAYTGVHITITPSEPVAA